MKDEFRQILDLPDGMYFHFYSLCIAHEYNILVPLFEQQRRKPAAAGVSQTFRQSSHRNWNTAVCMHDASGNDEKDPPVRHTRRHIEYFRGQQIVQQGGKDGWHRHLEMPCHASSRAYGTRQENNPKTCATPCTYGCSLRFRMQFSWK